ncbi:uncharacterized protein PV07_01765 [Cladophialophora immunda]|uniref:Uncharacterized protein n=1 Tax=Cladophialophora immunda TaxID=569365 RepID=A0A0D2BBX3_9EURO|nr:uncharacterized protein PV07_01765 [Cladophialophora immunda]KIW35037.1 hypothetical protein PV07_01765 [Cladophialophora immunda]
MSAPGGPPGPGAPRLLTAIERRKAINALRDRLRPNVTDRTLLETYLASTDWNIEDAYNLWQVDRARILAGRDDAQDSSSSTESDSEDEGEEREEEEEQDGAGSSSSSSSSSSLSDIPRAPAAAAAGEDDDDEKDEKDGEEEEEEEESKTLGAMRGNQVSRRFNANLEQERRDAALALRLHYESETEDSTTLSPSEAILLLHVNMWDLGEAIDSFTTLEDIRLQLSDFDRMRTSLPMEIDPDEVDIMREQDERLAEFVNITARPDWYSLRAVLQDHNWNLIEAVSFWFFRGVPPVRPPTREVQKSTKEDPDGKKFDFGIRVNINEKSMKWPTAKQCEVPPEVFMDDGWGVEPDQYTPDDAADTEDTGKKSKRGKKPQKVKKPDKRGAEGFLINIDGDVNERAHVGCPNPAKFLVEHISRGKYTFKRFKQSARFQWPGLTKGKASVPQSGQDLFDFEDGSHVQLLNNWRRQAIGRTIKSSRNEPGQPWCKEEDDYLIKLSEDLLEEKRKSSKPPKSKKLLVSNAKKEEWAEAFNKTFTGTIQADSKAPRTDRTVGAIMQRRSRIQELVDRFHVKPDNKYLAKLKQKAGQKRKRSDLSDDEDADQSHVATHGEDDPEEEDVPMDISSDDDEGDAPMDLSD